MKAIILAAGVGSRFGSYTRGRPKCLLEVGGISLIERQLSILRRCGVTDLVVVRGFAAEEIRLDNVRFYLNKLYDETNMVFSLFCAEPELYGEVLVSYGDILFSSQTLAALLSAPSYDIAVVVDTKWEEYYRERFEDPYSEAESLVFDSEGHILEIGESRPDPSRVMGQYIGLVRLSAEGSEQFRQIYNLGKNVYSGRVWKRGRTFEQAYMTDFLQALIDEGIPVRAVPTEHGWLEFDRVSDHEKVEEWLKEGTLQSFCRL